MDQGTTKLLFALLRSAIGGDLLTVEEKALYTEEQLSKLTALSKKHDLTHLLALGLQKNGLEDRTGSCTRELFKAMHRYEQQRFELNRTCATLEEAKIPFIPLKGSVLRSYYPEPWMRTSCDIDILVHIEDLERAIVALRERCAYQLGEKGSHDVSLFSSGGTHIELHYDLVEEGRARASSKILETVWQYVRPVSNGAYHHLLTDEMFYFYHIAHMAKHFEIGGCGIRPFIDLYIMDQLSEQKQEQRDALLRKGDLLQFGKSARALSQNWFSGAEYTETMLQMERFILCGGVYGSKENQIAIQQQKKGGRFKYFISRVFVSYSIIKFQYPILQKHRWLMPFMQVHRWFSIIFGGKASLAVQELKYNQGVSATEVQETKIFLKNIGLQ